ncbi:hypothetical protein [Fontibacillus sp. BL9]|uniref:hypothetical protein n=1 Tax=Fontibacillus sp. BL9 TaxID=3389971 RepID=UPI00397D583E
MIRKTLFIILMLSLFSACDSGSNRNINENTDSQMYALVNDLFYKQYSNQLSQFSDVLISLTKESVNDEMLSYLNGRIEGGASFTRSVLYSLEKTESSVVDKAIPPELRPSLFSILAETEDILDRLNQFIKEKDLRKVEENKILILEVVQLCDEINVAENVIKDESYFKEYDEKLIQTLGELRRLELRLKQ